MAVLVQRLLLMKKELPVVATRSYSSAKTHYDILGVPRTASKREIKAAFLQLSKQHHPDLNPETSRDKMVEINEAYSILSSPSSRDSYDRNLRTTDTYRRSTAYHRGFSSPLDNDTIDPSVDFPDVKYYTTSKPKHGRIVGLLLVVMVVATCVHTLRIQSFREKMKRKADIRDNYNKGVYKSVRAKAMNTTTSQQLEELKEKYS